MINNPNKKLLILPVMAIMMAIILPMTMRFGMFMDGKLYATIASNLANGLGSFWHPIFTGDIYSPFHEHPPLMFGIESIFYTIFGGSMYIERILTVLFAFLSAYLLWRIWKLTFENHHLTGWLVILFWFLTPIVFWSFSNNMLENLITICYLLGIIFTLRYKKAEKFRVRWLVYLGLCTISGFLIKGPVGLLPLIFPVLFLFEAKRSVKQTLFASVFTFVIFAAFFALLLVNDDARDNLQTYYDTQVSGSLGGDRVVVRRTFILERLFLEIAPFLGIAAIYFFIRIKRWSHVSQVNRSIGFRFLAAGLLAVLPIMISPKQLMFYVVPAIPFFVLGVISLFEEAIRSDVLKIISKKHYKKITLITTTVITLLAILMTVKSVSTYSRGKDWLIDINKVGAQLNAGDGLYIHASLSQNWSMFAEFQKHHDVSCYRHQMQKHMIAGYNAKIDSAWKPVDLDTKMIRLYVKK